MDLTGLEPAHPAQGLISSCAVTAELRGPVMNNPSRARSYHFYVEILVEQELDLTGFEPAHPAQGLILTCDLTTKLRGPVVNLYTRSNKYIECS